VKKAEAELQGSFWAGWHALLERRCNLDGDGDATVAARDIPHLRAALGSNPPLGVLSNLAEITISRPWFMVDPLLRVCGVGVRAVAVETLDGLRANALSEEQSRKRFCGSLINRGIVQACFCGKLNVEHSLEHCDKLHVIGGR